MVKSEVKESKVAEPKKEVKVEVPKPTTESNSLNIATANEKDELYVIASQLTSVNPAPPPKPVSK